MTLICGGCGHPLDRLSEELLSDCCDVSYHKGACMNDHVRACHRVWWSRFVRALTGHAAILALIDRWLEAMCRDVWWGWGIYDAATVTCSYAYSMNFVP